MIVKQINYNDDEQIEDITVRMSYKEALALVNVAGKLNGYAQSRLNIHNDSDSLYDALANVFTAHYEDGHPDLGIKLETLNEPIE